MKNIISASMLASDLTNIEKEIHRTENAQVEWLHIDVMDGVFVDNITYGNNVVAAMRKVSDIYFDTHLMVTDPTNLIPLFAKAGSNMLTIHLESKGNTEENLRGILSYFFDAGVKGIICMGIGTTMRDGDREYFYSALDRHFPGMKQRYISQYGNEYICNSVNNGRLMSIFCNECEKHGVMYEPAKVFSYLYEFPEKNEQLSFF